MAHLLHLDSSAAGAASRSRAVTHTFVEAWQAADPANTVTTRDLVADPLPHLPAAALHWAPALREPGESPSAAAEALQRSLIDELIAADVLLLGVPLYNYGLPSALKAWVDHIHVLGVTAPFGGDTQPMRGRAAVAVVSRGAVYDAGSPTADDDHATPALRLILEGALGMQLQVITTSLTLAERIPALAPQVPRSRGELAAAHEAAGEAAQRLGSARTGAAAGSPA